MEARPESGYIWKPYKQKLGLRIMATLRKLALLLTFSVVLAGCAHTISRDKLQGVLVERDLNSVDFWWYVGSDENYHYVKNHLLIGSKTYRIPKDELAIACPFKRTSDKSEWVLFHDLNRLRKGKPQQTDSSRTSEDTIDFRLRIRDKSSDEKVITRANLIRIKQFILKQGLRETYCNMYNNNPAFRTKSFSFYLNPDNGQENINCDTDKSDFHTLTIRKSGGGKNQYRTVEFLDKHYVYIVVSWPTKDLTVSQAREFVIEATKDILKEMEKEKPNKPDAGDGK